jgi:hypothetical protein
MQRQGEKDGAGAEPDYGDKPHPQAAAGVDAHKGWV